MNRTETDLFYAGNLPREWAFLEPLAADIGFVAVGLAKGGAVPLEYRRRYEAYLSRGYNAGMNYLSRHLDERWNVRKRGIVFDANVVIVAAMPYGSGATTTGFWRHVAAHARGMDYHQVVRNGLNALSCEVGRRFKGSQRRVFVDTAPILERSWALAAGIGSLLKNGMVMVPGVGPRVVLGEVVCAGVPEVHSVFPPQPFHLCEGCRLCIESCPTRALNAPAELDGRRCLSYWTIENRKDTLPIEVAGALDSLFGCDRCVACCPHDNPDIRSALPPPLSGGDTLVEVADFKGLDDATIQGLIESTPLERTGPWALRRNASYFAKNQM